MNLHQKLIGHRLKTNRALDKHVLWDLHLPGIVLSSTNATEPPTNIAVVSRTFSTWSICTIPMIEEKIRMVTLFLKMQMKQFPIKVCMYLCLCLYQWLGGFLWGSWAGPGRRRWRSQGQTGCGTSWDPQTAGWKGQRRWSCRITCRTALPELGPAMMRKEHWIFPPFLVVASVLHHTE